MHFIIVTGMSGAGKTTVLKIFESVGFHCVDNLPPSLMQNFAELCIREDIGIEKAAIGIDIRGGKLFNDFFTGLQSLDDKGFTYSILFLESSDDMLLQRYKESRHTHPLAKKGLISEGIEKEKKLLAPVKEKATHIIDTSLILARQLKEKIIDIYVNHAAFDSLIVHVMSFGFKYGIPRESDLVFDVRFLPNPFYDPVLKPQTGIDKPVSDFVMENEISRQFMDSISSLLKFLIPHYVKEGKNQLVIGIGCTGGRHRSVSVAHELYRSLLQAKHSVILSHRDIGKDTNQ